MPCWFSEAVIRSSKEVFTVLYRTCWQKLESCLYRLESLPKITIQHRGIWVLKYLLCSYQEDNQISKTLQAYLWSWIQGPIAMTDRVKLHLGTASCSVSLCSFRCLDALWAVNSRRQTGYHHWYFWLQRLPIRSMRFISIRFWLDYPRCQHTNHWPSVDSHVGTWLRFCGK